MSRAPLHALQGFIAAARTGNLSRAAESMHLTVSALSHQVRALEQRLEMTLLVRGPRGISLTAEGQQLFDRIAPHFEAIEHALRPRCGMRDDVLTLSVLPSLASSWLVPRLGSFVARHPEIEINLQSNVELVDFAKQTAIDAGLRFGLGSWPGVEAEHLFDDFVTPIAAPSLIKRLGKPKLADLGRFPLLGDPAGRWPTWFERYGGTPPKRYVAVFNDSESLHRAAVEGMGVALGRLTLSRSMIESGRLVQLSPKRLRAEYSHYLVYPQRSLRHRGFAAFREWLLDEARAYAPLMQEPEVSKKEATRRSID